MWKKGSIIERTTSGGEAIRGSRIDTPIGISNFFALSCLLSFVLCKSVPSEDLTYVVQLHQKEIEVA
jgi:hypothetical protein